MDYPYACVICDEAHASIEECLDHVELHNNQEKLQLCVKHSNPVSIRF